MRLSLIPTLAKSLMRGAWISIDRIVYRWNLMLKLRLIWLRHWLNNHQPVICAGCGKISFKKDVMYEQHRTAGVKPLCFTCHRELFEPWTHQDQSMDL
jgi:hypothetical protein